MVQLSHHGGKVHSLPLCRALKAICSPLGGLFKVKELWKIKDPHQTTRLTPSSPAPPGGEACSSSRIWCHITIAARFSHSKTLRRKLDTQREKNILHRGKSTMGHWNRVAICKPRIKQTCKHLDPGLKASRTVTNKCLFLSHLVWYFFIIALTN